MISCPSADWEHPVFTLDTDEAFRQAEQPQPRIIEWSDGKQDTRPLWVNLDKWNYPNDHAAGNAWTPKEVH